MNVIEYNNIIDKLAVSKANFDYDKALMYAAVCLILETEIPGTQLTEPSNQEFPYWIAFDKHTEVGRAIIIKASHQINLDSYAGMQLAFLMEGSLCNGIIKSPYWNHFMNWKLDKLGSAVDRWEELRNEIIELTNSRVEMLLEKIYRIEETPQLSLF